MVEERAQRASRNHHTGLTDAIAAADWPALLPPHRADGDDQPVGRPACVATLSLADGLVLAVVEDERGAVYPVPLVVSDTAVRRAQPGDGASEALVRLLSAGDSTGSATPAGDRAPTDDARGGFETTTWHHEPASGERAIPVDQTNESVIVGDHAVVKWTFLAGEGPHPAPSILAELERHGFAGMPRPWGAVQWRDTEDSAPRLLALVTDFVPGAVDGWTWVVDDLRDAATSGDEEVAAAAGRRVGEVVASFHRALAGTVRLSTEQESAAWRADAVAELDRALAVTSGPAHQVIAAHQVIGAHQVLATHEAEVRALLDAMPAGPTPVMRVHGDLHVGQVLRSQLAGSSTYLLTDFDGNPVLSPAARLAAQPAAQDVAGMLQSFLHAGLVVRRHNPSLPADAVDVMAEVARRAFLDAYRTHLGDQGEVFDERLVRPFALRQVCREFIYAATHLPRWSYVPEGALPMLLSSAASQRPAPAPGPVASEEKA